MADVYIDAPAIGQRLGGKSARTGRRVIDQGHLSVYMIQGRRYVKESEFNVWIESRRIDQQPAAQPNSLKTMLETISAKALAGRKGAA